MADDPNALKQKYAPKELKVLPTTRQMSSARFTPCGKFLVACGHDGLVHRWDAQSDEFKSLPTTAGHNGWVQEVVFDAAGLMYTADSWGGLRCWPYAGEKLEPKWAVASAHNGWIRGLAISRDAALLATVGADRKARVWNAADGTRIHEFEHAEQLFSVGIHPDGKSVVTGDLKGIVRQWDLATKAVTRTFDCSTLFVLNRLQDVGGARSLEFSADGTSLAVAGCKPTNGGTVVGVPTVLLVDWSNGQIKQTIAVGPATDAFVTDVRFHPAGFLLAVATGQPGSGKLACHQPGEEKPFFETTHMPNCHSISVHPNAHRVAVVATNGGSNGNGRNLKDGQYPGNFSPIHILDMPA